MAFDPVPFFVGGGALHSAETARQLVYAATGGAAGVAAAGDLKITQLPVAGTSVRAASGGAVIPSLYPGASQQSYTVRAASTTDVSVTATGSGAGRVDLVIARIDDPQYGGTIPADVTVGPYVRLDIIQNVAAGSTDIPAGLTYPAIALARLDIPASTATITTSMITPLAVVANPAPMPQASRRYDGTAATYSLPTANVTVPVTTWSTATFNTGDITYAAGVYTVHTAGKYEWAATVQWPGTGTQYRVVQFALVNGTSPAAGEASRFFSTAESGLAEWLTSGFTVDLAAGGTVQLGLQCSTGGLTGVQPVAFSLTRVA